MPALKNMAYINTIAAIGCARRKVTRHVEISRPTSLEPSWRLKELRELPVLKGTYRTSMLHKQMHNFSPRYNNNTPWRSRILRPPHKLIGHRLRCSQRRFQSCLASSRYSRQNSPQCRPRTRRWKNQDSNQPQLGRDIGRPTTRPRRSLTKVKITTYILEADRGLTQMGTAPLMDTRWRIHTRHQHAVLQVMVTTSQLRD